MTTIVDTDALIALLNIDDLLHKRATALAEKVHEQAARLIVSPTTLAELSLVGLKTIGLPRLKQALADLRGKAIIESVTENDVSAAIELFQKQQSKDESLCDCFVMVLARRLHAACIFSFDRGYSKNGFVLAEDLFATLLR
jgi:predicted nucleic acid-binding protein